MENASTHEDDAFVLRAQEYLATGLAHSSAGELIRGLLDRVLEKKVEVRGLESQCHSLQQDRIGLDVEVATLTRQRTALKEEAQSYCNQLEKANEKLERMKNMMVGD